jgi:hypothetical protein
MAWTAEQEEIHVALNKIMKACGLDQSESSTEALFAILDNAVTSVAEQYDDVVGQSHRDGLCYDVNAWLAQEIAKAASALAAEEQAIN